MTVAPTRSTWTGASVRRKEDARLLTGRGQYVDDLHLPGTLHAAFLRSPHAHARIRDIEVTAARNLKGVVSVLTGRDLGESLQPLPVMWVLPGQHQTSYPALPDDKVLYAGQPVAVVVAEDRYTAEDALELLQVDYEPLPAAVDTEQALEPGSPLLYEDWGTNIVVTSTRDHGDVETAFRQAAHVFRQRFHIQRHSGFPMETRGVLAQFDPPREELTVWTSTQVPHHVRTVVAECLDFPEYRVRVLAPDVGGGFGLKDRAHPEEIVVAWLSRHLNRPVKWIEDRQEHFTGTVHAREQVHEVEVAVGPDGRIAGIRERLLCDVGAHLISIGIGPAYLGASMLPGPYRVENYAAVIHGVVTNKTPFGAYRGFGAPQSTFVMERMMDIVADGLGLDPAEVRFRNFLQPEDLPRESVTGHQYDSGNYPECLRRALQAAGYDEFRLEQERLRQEGRYLGIGIGCYVGFTALGPSETVGKVGFRAAGYESAVVRMDRQGRVTVFTGVSPHGQGLETSLAQLCADQLSVAMEDVRVVHGDTTVCPYSGMGTVASRSASLGGAAVILAAGRIREKLLALAAWRLEAATEDLRLESGEILVSGVPGRSMSIAEVATLAHLAHQLPPGMAPGLEEREVYDPVSCAYSCGAHIPVVEVDTTTGLVEIVKYMVVHDCGTVINPMIVEGQIQGGVAQGIGGALLEELVYDEQGQLLTQTFMDYLLPTAMDMPPIFSIAHMESPSRLPGGMKGVGESGTIPALGAVANAVADALRPFGVEITETPLTPARIRALLNRRS